MGDATTFPAWINALKHEIQPTLEDRRIRNRRSLSNITLDPSGQTVLATPEQKLQRENQQMWRARRCGADPISYVQQATILQCMGCEGIVVARFFTRATIFQGNIATSEELARNSHSHPDLFAFGSIMS